MAFRKRVVKEKEFVKVFCASRERVHHGQLTRCFDLQGRSVLRLEVNVFD